MNRAQAVGVALAVTATAALSAGPSGTTSLAPDSLPPRDFVSFLLGMDVVFVGKVVVRQGVAEVAVDSVVLGMLPEQGEPISWEVFAHEARDKRMIAWGHVRGTPLRFAGSRATIERNGSIVLPEGFSTTDPEGYRLAGPKALDSTLAHLRRRRGEHAVEAFDGARAAIQVTLGERASRKTWLVTDARTLVGAEHGKPVAVHFDSQMGYCGYVPTPGDKLVLPVVTPASDDTLALAVCPDGLHVRGGAVRAFAQKPVDQLSNWLIWDGQRIRVRRGR